MEPQLLRPELLRPELQPQSVPGQPQRRDLRRPEPGVFTAGLQRQELQHQELQRHELQQHELQRQEFQRQDLHRQELQRANVSGVYTTSAGMQPPLQRTMRLPPQSVQIVRGVRSVRVPYPLYSTRTHAHLPGHMGTPIHLLPGVPGAHYPCPHPQVYGYPGWAMRAPHGAHGLPYGQQCGLPYGPDKDQMSPHSPHSQALPQGMPQGMQPQPPSPVAPRDMQLLGPEHGPWGRPIPGIPGLPSPIVGHGSPDGVPDSEGLDVSEVEVHTSGDALDSLEHREASDAPVTFSTIEEALASIDSPSTDQLPDHLPPIQVPCAGRCAGRSSATCPGLSVANEKQEEVIKAAKSLFSKRTRTLYHWLYPETSKTKLKATVSAAWDTLADAEKQFYLSQVLGRFGLQASSLMINPQLDGIKGLPSQQHLQHQQHPLHHHQQLQQHHQQLQEPSGEAQQAVDELFASCADSDTWTSYSTSPSSLLSAPAPAPTPAAPRSRANRKRAWSRGPGRSRAAGPSCDSLDDEESLKRMREARLEAELQEDPELSSELEKFRALAGRDDRDNERDDFWRRTPDPDDIFTHLDF